MERGDFSEQGLSERTAKTETGGTFIFTFGLKCWGLCMLAGGYIVQSLESHWHSLVRSKMHTHPRETRHVRKGDKYESVTRHRGKYQKTRNNLNVHQQNRHGSISMQ